jgi:hypothetical protein
MEKYIFKVEGVVFIYQPSPASLKGEEDIFGVDFYCWLGRQAGADMDWIGLKATNNFFYCILISFSSTVSDSSLSLGMNNIFR